MSIRRWITNDHTIRWDQANEVPDLWKPLLFSWSYTINAVGRHYNEASQRSLVDSMLQLVFYYSAERPEETSDVLYVSVTALRVLRPFILTF